ncbi:hypothetical protein KKH38_03955 [Patescibacteria group bacterium]|nr:hypothetical protein [Patescibacteria group bacterium]MBU4601375.1 hypothetical protein [Patescibacteria group bacterium]MCG2698193.1 hypothetical protein [Candidatus Parcubacteria bacterium]
MQARRKTTKTADEEKRAAGRKKAAKKIKLNVRVKSAEDSAAAAEAEKPPRPAVISREEFGAKENAPALQPEQKKVFAAKERKNNFAAIEKNKNAVMRAGVCFFMVLIIAVWAFNFKKSFVKLESENKSESINWPQIMDEFSESINRMKEELDEAKSAVNESVLSGAATGTAENLSASQDEIKEMKARLEELESKLEGDETQKH